MIKWAFSDDLALKIAKHQKIATVGDGSLIPGVGRSPGEENGNPLQYSCLGNTMDRGA